MQAWVDDLAKVLGEQPIDPQEIRAVLKLARGVAHGVERRLAPVSAYLAVKYVAHRTAEGVTPQSALRSLMATARQLVPEPFADRPDSAT